jgi:hypothetical protein
MNKIHSKLDRMDLIRNISLQTGIKSRSRYFGTLSGNVFIYNDIK